MQHSLFEDMQPNNPRQPALRQADVSGRAWTKKEKERFRELFFNTIRSVWQREYNSSMYDVLKYAQQLINDQVESVEDARVKKGKPCR